MLRLAYLANFSLVYSSYLSSQKATTAGLAYVDPNTKHAIIKVDNTSTITDNQNRDSIKITTKASYDLGSVWIADIFHAPYGCGVAPSMWSWARDVGINSWPDGGGIVSFGAVNEDRLGHAAIKAKTGCNLTAAADDAAGTVDCGDNSTSCSSHYISYPSYGSTFNNVGGAVFVTEFAATAISVWVFSRNSVKASLLTASSITSIETFNLGSPTAKWYASICGPEGFSNIFKPQALEFSIGLCGLDAGSAYNKTCAPGDCYIRSILGDGSNIRFAHFDIGSIRVFTLNGSPPSSADSSSESVSASATKEGTIIGAVVGGVGGFLAICGVAFIIYKKRKPQGLYIERSKKRVESIDDTRPSTNEPDILYNPMFEQAPTISSDDKRSNRNVDAAESPAFSSEEPLNALVPPSSIDTSNETAASSLRRELEMLRREVEEMRENVRTDPAPPTYYPGSQGDTVNTKS